MEMTMKQAAARRAAMERAAESLDDKTASTAPELFRRLKGDGKVIEAGTRINWRGAVKRAAVTLWDNAASTPETAPTLWEDILYREGIRVIPAHITVGMAFGLDELGWWGETVMRSKRSDNVWTPEQNADAWEPWNGSL